MTGILAKYVHMTKFPFLLYKVFVVCSSSRPFYTEAEIIVDWTSCFVDRPTSVS